MKPLSVPVDKIYQFLMDACYRRLSLEAISNSSSIVPCTEWLVRFCLIPDCIVLTAAMRSCFQSQIAVIGLIIKRLDITCVQFNYLQKTNFHPCDTFSCILKACQHFCAIKNLLLIKSYNSTFCHISTSKLCCRPIATGEKTFTRKEFFLCYRRKNRILEPGYQTTTFLITWWCVKSTVCPHVHW